MKTPLSILCVLLFAGCASVSDVDDTRRRLSEVDQRAQNRLTELESKIGNEKLLEMVNQVERLTVENAKMRGDIELLNYNLQTTQKRQNDLYNDLDQRLAPLEGGTARPVASAPATSASTPAASTTAAPATAAASNTSAANAEAVSTEFNKALDILRARNFAAAVTALKGFISKNPEARQAADAQYWLGVAYTAEKQYQLAATTQQKFVDANPEHAKVPEALRNIGNCYSELGNASAAKASWDKLLRRFPKSDAAAKVRQQQAKN